MTAAKSHANGGYAAAVVSLSMPSVFDVSRDKPIQALQSRYVMLTRREREVLEFASLGLHNKQIAEKLDLSVHAIKFHLSSVYRKLGVANRTEAVVHHLSVHSVAPGSGEGT